MTGIYILTNLINNKKYVGQSAINIQKRIKRHRCNYKRLRNQPINMAIQKYSWENFSVYIYECLEENLDWFEIELIKILDTLVPNGYNLETGGNHNKHASDETKKKQSLIHTNFHHTNESKKKISLGVSSDKNGFFGKHHTQQNKEEHSLRMSNENNPMYGRIGYEHPLFGKTADKCHKWKGNDVVNLKKEIRRRKRRELKRHKSLL